MRRLGETFESLEQVVAARKADPSPRSYTSRLLAGGVPGIGAKVTEEAGELVAAGAGAVDPVCAGGGAAGLALRLGRAADLP